ncbi:MAG: ABC transporter permease [Bacteroidales bacterium]|nr:ABC transporter permease [Bacteroidales bacterium]
MFKFFAAYRKEWLILIRDPAGLIVLFLMPMVMVVVLSMVQEFGWSTISKEPQVPVLFVNLDQDSVGNKFQQGLSEAKIFTLITALDSIPITEETARQEVLEGNYQIAVVIPEQTSERLRAKIRLLVSKTMTSLMMPDNDILSGVTNNDSVEILIYFDPAVRNSFRNAFLSATKEFNSRIESRMIFETFQDELRNLFPKFNMPIIDYQESVYFKEIFPSGVEEEILPSTTQHNVPSWAIFAMFFIVIPLTSSIIKEREEGSLIRLMTIPVSYMTVFMSKVGVYLLVCFIQFVLMVLAGIFVLPLFKMPALELGTNYFAIAVLAIVSSLAALGYGILIGTVSRTHQQAAAFGAVSVVVLAAMGGLWVPVYLMQGVMKHIATFSPLNWAHAGFLDLFLRGSTLVDILPEIIKLLLFFAVTISIAAIYRTLKPPVSK